MITIHPATNRFSMESGCKRQLKSQEKLVVCPSFGSRPGENPDRLEQKPQPAGNRAYRTLIWLFTGILAAGIGGNAFQTRLFNNYIEKKDTFYKAELQKQAKEKAMLSDLLAAQMRRLDNLSQRATLERIVEVAQRVTPATVRVEGRVGLGSGVILQDLQGKLYVLTNAHVTEGDALGVYDEEYYRIKLYNGSDTQGPVQFESSTVRLPDGTKAESSSSKYDLALLEIPASVKLPESVVPVELRDMKQDPIRVGEVVIAVGNPMGDRDSVSSGIISHIDRKYKEKPENIFLGTDTPINPGNSGGGLFDMQGRLVGINTLGIRGSDGIGGAIRIDIIRDVLKSWNIEPAVPNR